MNIRVTVFLAVILSEIILPQINQTDQKRWVLFQSPTRNKISQVISFDNGKAIAAANKLYLYDRGTWKKFPVQPPVQNISRIYALNENHIWITYDKFSNESDLYLYKNGYWRKMNYPLMNNIHSLHLNQSNTGWFCGDREIAYSQFNKHFFIPFPSIASSIRNSFSAGKSNLWVSALSKGLYHYDGKKWETHFRDEKVKYFCFTKGKTGYALIEDGVYKYSGNVWELHSRYELLKNVNKIFVNGEEIWGIGNNGLLVHYKKNWEPVKLSVKTDLYDISFSRNGRGWIVGDKGLILSFTNRTVMDNYVYQPGFDRQKILVASKENSDEYGVVIEDFDGDGLKDIYTTCIFELNRFYKNHSDGNQILFSEEALNRNISGRIGDPNSVSLSELYLGAGSADIDNDGDQDLYLCDLINNNKLLLNEGDGYFRNVSFQNNRATNYKERTNSAVFSDVDNDGDLDLFITNEYSSNRLFLNNGYGYFKEITVEAGLETDFGGMGCVFTDLDGDNLPDLFVTNWSKPNLLFKNISKNGLVAFEKIETHNGIDGGEIKKSNAVIAGDYDNDGDMDLFVTNRKFSNRLYRNDGEFNFVDVTREMIGLDSALSYGANFADFDNDGFLDLFVANVGENILYRNIRGKKFVDVTESYGVELGGYSTGSATADIDNDGDVDLYVSNYLDENSILFLNNINNSNFINVNIKGIKSNRDGVGTKIWLYHGGRAEQKEHLLGYREVSGGSGYSSKDTREIHFGVKQGIYDLVIYFPASGIKQIIRYKFNGEVINVSELNGFEAHYYTSLNTLCGLIYSRENQKEFVKLFVILLLFSSSFLYGVKRYNWKFKYSLIAVLPILIVYLLQIYFLRYENVFYSTIVPLGSVLLILLTIHLIYEQKVMKEKVREEQQKTRDMLARDLHDDLASTISSALIYTEMVEKSVLSESAKHLLSKIRSLLMDSAKVVTDIIWTVSSRHDNIEELVQRLQGLMDDLCKANSIEFSSEFKYSDIDKKISDDIRRNIYLIYKEAINNTIRHSAATKVKFDVVIEENLLNFSLYDNGVGFDKLPDIIDFRKSPGHGLRNIRARAGEINADLQIKSVPKQGTYINLKQKIS
jgi:enediyne biosynthesis protein E4